MKPTIDWIKQQDIREARLYEGNIYVSLAQDDTVCSDTIYKINRIDKSVKPVNHIDYKFGKNGSDSIYAKSKPVNVERLKQIL